MVNPSNILSLAEIRTVVDSLRGQRGDYPLMKLCLFRLSACCGLRRKEIAGLDVGDLKRNGEWPYIVLRKDVVKGERGKRKARQVPLWWDPETYDDLSRWQEYRLDYLKGEIGPFLCTLRCDHYGRRLRLDSVAKYWRRILTDALGIDRAKAVSIHKGRHSFTSHAIAAGIPLPAVRDALGHSSLAVTDIYAHQTDHVQRAIFAPIQEI